MGTGCMARRTPPNALWQPKREGNPRKRRFLYTCATLILLYSRNEPRKAAIHQLKYKHYVRHKDTKWENCPNVAYSLVIIQVLCMHTDSSLSPLGCSLPATLPELKSKGPLNYFIFFFNLDLDFQLFVTHVPGIYRHFVSFLFKKIFFSTQFPRDTPAAAGC